MTKENKKSEGKGKTLEELYVEGFRLGDNSTTCENLRNYLKSNFVNKPLKKIKIKTLKKTFGETLDANRKDNFALNMVFYSYMNQQEDYNRMTLEYPHFFEWAVDKNDIIYKTGDVELPKKW